MALRWLIHITINLTGVYIRCKITKNTKHDRRIGSKQIEYINVCSAFEKVSKEKLNETDKLQESLT